MDGTTKRVLVVHDQSTPPNRLADSLKRAGFLPVPCGSPEDAARQADLDRIDVAVVEGDDVGLLKALKTRSPKTRVIVHSRHATLESAKRALRLGAFGFVENDDGEAGLAREVHRALQNVHSDESGQLSATRPPQSDGVGVAGWSNVSAASLGRILERSLNEIYVFDSHTLRFLYCNRGARKNLGYSDQELQQLTPLDLKPEFTWPSFSDLVRPLRDGRQESIVFETLHRRRDDSRYPVEVHLQLMQWGRQAAFVAIVLDITKRKNAESQLQLTRFAAEHAPGAMFTIDPTGRFIEVNQVACRRLEYAREELLSMGVPDIDVNASDGVWSERWEELKQKGQLHFESVHRTRSGRTFPVEISSSYFQFDGEEYACSFVSDTSTRKMAEQQLRDSEQQLKSVLDGVPAYILSHDRAGRILFINRTLKGLALADVLGRPVYEFLTKEAGHIVRKAMDAVFDTGEVQHYEIPGPGDYGREAWYSCRLAPVFRGEHVVSAIAFSTDVTAIKSAEHTVRENEQRFSEFIEQVPFLVWMASPGQPDLTYVNPAFESMIGVPRESMISPGHDWLRFIHNDDRPILLRQLRDVMRSSSADVTEFRVVRPDGAVRWLRHHALIHRDARGNAQHYVGIAEDFTERRLMSEQLAERQAELAHVTRLSTMGEMVTSIAHELAQPLSAVLNFAGACQKLLISAETEGECRVAEHVEQIHRQSQRAGHILSRLRDYVRKSAPRKSTIRVSTLMSNAVELVSYELRHRGIRVRSDVATDSHVIADRVQIEQVLVNLIRNAADAMESTPKRERVIRMSTCVAGDTAILNVADNGCGIRGDCDRIFDAFYTTKAEGTGMGLAICRTILVEHGGIISASNNQSGGATFQISLPQLTAGQHG